jgi:predicted dehydrogenase
VIHNWLFEPSVLEAESLVRQGLLGPLIGIQVEALSPKEDSMAANKNHWSHRLPGGRFSEMLAHPIYLVRHFLGEIEMSHIEISKIGDYPWMISDELCATLRVGNKLGRAYASFNAPRDAIFISLYGKRAIVRLDVINSTVNFLDARRTTRLSKGVDSLRQSSQLVRDTAKNASRIAFGRWLSGHDTYIQRFAESLIANTAPPVSAKEGYFVVKTLEEMCKQIETAERRD